MGKNFDQLPAATALTGAETLAVNQSGVTAKTTVQAIADLAPEPDLSGTLQKASNLSDLSSASTARTNLGLGTAATRAVGNAANDILAFDGSGRAPAIVSPRMNTIVIAAVDSVNGSGADAVCTGTADDVLINSAIDSLTNGGSVSFRHGTYQLSSNLVLDRDRVSLVSETVSPHWLRYNGPYPLHEQPGTPGGAMFVQNTTGKSGLVVGQTNFHGGDGRHKGLAFVGLCFYGLSYSATGFVDAGGTDISVIQNCMFHGWTTGIDVTWDAGHILNNNIQDNSGAGIISRRSYCTIQGNLCFDLGNAGIISSATGDRIIGNMVGDLGAYGILLEGPNSLVANNYIESVAPNNHGIVSGYGIARNHTITGNTILMTGDTAPNQTPNPNGTGILIGPDAAVNGCCITGNNVINSASTSGYAIHVVNGTGGLVAANNVGLWNGTNKIQVGSYATS